MADLEKRGGDAWERVVVLWMDRWLWGDLWARIKKGDAEAIVEREPLRPWVGYRRGETFVVNGRELRPDVDLWAWGEDWLDVLDAVLEWDRGDPRLRWMVRTGSSGDPIYVRKLILRFLVAQQFSTAIPRDLAIPSRQDLIGNAYQEVRRAFPSYGGLSAAAWEVIEWIVYETAEYWGGSATRRREGAEGPLPEPTPASGDSRATASNDPPSAHNDSRTSPDPSPDTSDLVAVIDRLAEAASATSLEKGFPCDWSRIAEKLALAAGELVGEALEVVRSKDWDPGDEGQRRRFTEEVADCVIRCLDLCGRLGLPLGEVLIEKMGRNRDRDRLHGKRF